MGIWGWMTAPELTWLHDTASTMDSVVEIGCLHGRSAFALLTACPGTVYCIDPWNDEHDRSYPSFMGNCGHFPNLVPIRAASPQAATQVPDADMVFIDGAHAYGSVLADIAAWLPKTRKLICGHDYITADYAGYPDVAKAVHEVFGEDRVTCPEGTAIWTVDLTHDRSVNPQAFSGDLTYTDEYARTITASIAWPT
jgi:predicted O-methyltransferase YrrM